MSHYLIAKHSDTSRPTSTNAFYIPWPVCQHIWIYNNLWGTKCIM